MGDDRVPFSIFNVKTSFLSKVLLKLNPMIMVALLVHEDRANDKKARQRMNQTLKTRGRLNWSLKVKVLPPLCLHLGSFALFLWSFVPFYQCTNGVFSVATKSCAQWGVCSIRICVNLTFSEVLCAFCASLRGNNDPAKYQIFFRNSDIHTFSCSCFVLRSRHCQSVCSRVSR